jgi:glycosyltransferase involved in cell wall biosynthesis
VSTIGVTVVIPTRNRRELLARAALASALRQTSVDIEVLVVDDGSTDGTARWIAELGDPRVRVIRHEAPRGVAAARNAGIADAAAPWVAFLDDDDHWSPEKLATQVAALEATGALFAYTGALVVDGDGEPQDVLAAPPSTEIRAQLLKQNVMPAGSSNVVASTGLLRRLGGFDEQLGYLADWDLWIRLAVAGGGVACDDTLVAYVRHSGQMRLTGKAAIAELDRLRARHASSGFAPDGSRLLSWVASEQRRRGRRTEALGTYLLATMKFRDLRWVAQILATPLDSAGLGLRDRLRRREPRAPSVTRPEWVPVP